LAKQTIAQYNRKLQKQANELLPNVNNSLRDLALFGSRFAKFIAPKKSGSLAASIGYRKTKNGHAVVSGKPRGKTFPYHLGWNNLDGGALYHYASAHGWNLTGQAGQMGFRKNEYMKATSKVLKTRIPEKMKETVRLTFNK